MLVEEVFLDRETAEFRIYFPVDVVDVEREQLGFILMQFISQINGVVAFTDPLMLQEELILGCKGFLFL